MPAAKVLQPVLKMKVDELFLCWLSNTTTQLMLKDYLKRIKNGEKVEVGSGDATEHSLLACSKNKAHSDSKQNVLDKLNSPMLTPSSPPSQFSAALPSGTCSSPRNGPNARGVRRSTSVKMVQTKKEDPLPPALSETIPKFYFPRGCPKGSLDVDAVIARIENAFSQFQNEKATLGDMGKVAKACECPLYWKSLLFYAAGGDRTGSVSVHKFIAMWRKVLQNCHDDAAKFVSLLVKPSCNYLEQEDFIPFLQDVVNNHPGLTFLKEAAEFHSRYITTVIQRIFYSVNRSWSGRITSTELRKSSFLQNVALLEEEDDINQLPEYFSYEHFYVIYCKFWELDTDHDLYIDQKDLARHNDHAISNRMIERIFSGAVTRGRKAQKEGKISYADFVWFLISEEDKKTPTSIEYWFRCMDLDGDGLLSMYELEYFYEEQCQKLENMAVEPLPFEDCLCQMLDLVKPEHEGKITLHDLKKCKMANIFFDAFFNIQKYLDHEQKDPFSVQRDIENDGQEISDWERYAAEEYDILVAEEAANEQWTDGYEIDLDPLDRRMGNDFSVRVERKSFFEMPSIQSHVDLDEYEYEDDFE
ncbi:serine/threonine-protein phosphatase 2A regulatory subunit B'' subunit beta isoform X1 [Latimeria chalumnae]|uniref:serine/threonine-protein phosphatase 2A regulatory subunit B'' subunit beta isoform X1 n=1 Tax=Latimeria chalumnae TaxID=7897 RepID=UPI0003C18D54|nr:PREDICTED: serine/threonine-protein phosphatase 2A regulatory subunit B'' subunit beta isoform X1 [Latimeria chalumnae]XP_005999044.1 PREDICTED: serine/threonine-protein phosphatase 2A regulatory subunit B'' subunit beta isoform X1 [Latimeria chalumnae]XP_005999045.1 PREDICTED: serine/threonine-protein phosphatase 2A regulatory subunit B'' subunit beta isoform X1 [Latimeria chalumnae]XP_005999046.1 PREDICTED: serine/threonine-protein phosphatase 2A regulatory subunit B'' subunit beta isoform |eukprot:XP_005999043.1 PREDICTED: serine/threonine-protein phosphatase 2A regulatory subunit B'' subunit beta isoform X1 [Latimeria chalumnae]